MSEKRARFDYLLSRYLSNNCSWEEQQELFTYIDDEAYKDSLFAIMDVKDRELPVEHHNVNWPQMYQQIVESGNRKKQVLWMRLSGIAAVLVLCFCAYFLFYQTSLFRKAENPVTAILPGNNKAILTLADGSQIVLDHATNGVLASQANSAITKIKDGQLLYNAQENMGGNTNEATSYNTVATPRGGQYQVILPDGTRVWLNSASYLRFPTAFKGKERSVELFGEAYFEVAKNPEKPFKLKVRDMHIEVLGTHFNVMAYEDEPLWKTTLLEGKVKVGKGSRNEMLMPGQQARLNKAGNIQVERVEGAVTEAIAWKNGYFSFSRADLQSIMRQVARWYDVEVVYAGKIPNDEYVGEIRRSADIKETLRILELSHLKFSVEGRKITVLP